MSTIIGVNVKYLRNFANLTLAGFASAIGISTVYLRQIEKGEANISHSLAKQTADFFEIKVDALSSEKAIRLKDLSQIRPIQKFYRENLNNPEFFEGRKKENSVAHFLKTCLIPCGYLNEYRRVNEIQAHIKAVYNKEFSSKALSRQLNRLVEDGLLLKEDVFSNRSIYLYIVR